MKPQSGLALQTARLILRPPVLADADAIFAAMSDWEVVRTLAQPPWPYRREDALAWLNSLPPVQAAGEKHVFALCPAGAPERCIGMAGLDRREPDREIHLGFWLARPFWGRGLMTEAVAVLLRYGFETLDLPRIRSGYFRDNPASIRVHQKLGFRVLAHDAHYCAPRGEMLGHARLELTRADWAAAVQAAAPATRPETASG